MGPGWFKMPYVSPACHKRRLNGNNRKGRLIGNNRKGWPRVGTWTSTLKEPYEMSMALGARP